MITTNQDIPTFLREVLRCLKHVIVFSFLWWLLTSPRWDSWIVGGPTVLAAAMVARLIDQPLGWRWSLIGFLQFVPHFVRCSFLGGVDVAWRSLHPRLPIDPQLIDYNLRLPDGAARVFFMNVVNLLPGTVSADVCDDVLIVHVIDGRQPMHQQLAKLEHVVAGLFATRLEASEEQGESTS